MMCVFRTGLRTFLFMGIFMMNMINMPLTPVSSMVNITQRNDMLEMVDENILTGENR